MRATKLYATGDIRTVDVDVPSQAKNEISSHNHNAKVTGSKKQLYQVTFFFNSD